MRKYISLAASVGLAVIVGCSQDIPTSTASTQSASNSTSAVDGSKYLLDSEPDDGAGVIQARDAAGDEEEVVVIGRIGGSKSPWIDGQAAFLIVDASLKSCADVGSDKCPTPWDYC